MARRRLHVDHEFMLMCLVPSIPSPTEVEDLGKRAPWSCECAIGDSGLRLKHFSPWALPSFARSLIPFLKRGYWLRFDPNFVTSKKGKKGGKGGVGAMRELHILRQAQCNVGHPGGILPTLAWHSIEHPSKVKNTHSACATIRHAMSGFHFDLGPGTWR